MNRRHLAPWTFFLAAAFALVPISVTRLGGQAPQTRPGVVALRGGTLVTVTRGTIPNGTIVLRDGKIAALGANVTIPAGAEVIDVTGKFVSPGIIDAHSHIAADADQRGRHGRVVDGGASRTCSIPTTSTSTATSPAGLTIANILHGSANAIGGEQRGDQAALGQEARRGSALRRRDARHQVRPRREPEAAGQPDAAEPAGRAIRPRAGASRT